MFVFNPFWKFEGSQLENLRNQVITLRSLMAIGSLEDYRLALHVYDNNPDRLALFLDDIEGSRASYEIDADRLKRLIALFNIYSAKQMRAAINVYQQVFQKLVEIGPKNAASIKELQDNQIETRSA